jgi:glycosyltransferase involved in cell wall biosynthesis
MKQHNLYEKGPRVSYWHLGSDFANMCIAVEKKPDFTRVHHPYLLMVGTIEPRKSYELALNMMEILWEQGHELNLCIAGKEGWLVDKLMIRLRSHPLLNRKLFLFETITDSELAELYAHAAGLLFLSKGEGFGLPLVEAAAYGIDVICSDIPVFREIAGEYVSYVDLSNVNLLADQLVKWWQRLKAKDLPNPRKIPQLTWEESADSLLNVILDQLWLENPRDLCWF